MGYNLWLSDDTRYTLGFRVGAQAGITPDPQEAEATTHASPSEPTKAEMEYIDFLMEKLARRLASARIEGSSSAGSIAC